MPGPDPLGHLVEAAREGDDRAVAELVRRTQVDVWRLCHALGTRGEEQDLVQETYLRALQALPRFRGDSPVRSWLLAVARNVCADHVRRHTRRRRLLERLGPLAEPTIPGPAMIDDLLGALSTDRREAFALTQMMGLSYDEAAAILEVPVGTIRSRVARARAELLVIVRRSEAL